jgi:hypothetical protein
LNKAEFHIVAARPENLNKAHLAELKNILADFPWFQAGHAMLLRTLHNLNHYDFDKQLHHTAIMVPDREVLHHYLYGIEREKIVSQPYTAGKPIAETVINPQPEPLENTPTFAEEVEQKILDSLEQEEDISANTTTTEIIPEKLPEEQFLENEELPTSEVEIENTELNETIKVQPTASAEPLTIAPNETHSFSEWLSLLKQPHHISKQESEKTDEDIDSDEQATIEEEGDKTESQPKSNISEFESILDRFIRENPRISRPKAEFYNPGNMARQSVEEDEELVTETLAQLYYKQKAYKKAIRAYEKLSLIYPHRIAYFADLIQKIKNEIKE